MKSIITLCLVTLILGACHFPVAYVLDVPSNQQVRAFYRYSDKRPWIPFDEVTDLRTSAIIEDNDVLVYISYAGNPPKFIQIRTQGEVLELTSRMDRGKLIFVDGHGNEIEASSNHVNFDSNGGSDKILVDYDGLWANSERMSARVLKIE